MIRKLNTKKIASKLIEIRVESVAGNCFDKRVKNATVDVTGTPKTGQNPVRARPP
jgi:hypothetical protein